MKEIVYVDMDGVLCDYYGAHTKATKRNPKNQFPQCEYGFFLNLEPLPNAVDCMKWLIQSPKYEVYILTAPSVMNPLCYMEKRVWIEKYFGMDLVNNMIISPHKHLNKGDYLIDDNLIGRGQNKFEGELIHFGSEKFPNWMEVIIYFNKK